MGVLFTDNANRANGAIGANWTNLGGALTIASNQIAIPATDAVSYVNTVTPAADCYIKAVFVNIGNNAASNYSGLTLRFDTTSFNWYQLIIETSNGARIRRFDGGVGTTLGASFAGPSAGQTVEFRIVGSTLSVYYNGVLETTRSDATYGSAGRGGIVGRGSTLRLDDLEIGEPGGPVTYEDTHAGSVAATDSYANKIIAGENHSESVSATDAYAPSVVSGQTHDESVEATDSYAPSVVAHHDHDESVEATDEYTDHLIAGEPHDESIAATDEYTDHVVASETHAESVAATDSYAVTVVGQIDEHSESVAATDAYTDHIIAGEAHAESVSATDAYTDTIIARESHSESVSATDDYQVTVVGQPDVYEEVHEESVTATDAYDVTVIEANPPAPAPVPATGAPTGHRIQRPRVAVRIDGTLYVGDYAEIAELVERRATADATRMPAKQSRTTAKKTARSAAAAFKKAITVETPPVLAGFDPQFVIAQVMRDLQRAYSEQLVQALVYNNQIEMERDDEQAAMAAAELLLA